jgi:hypothetical protein
MGVFEGGLLVGVGQRMLRPGQLLAVLEPLQIAQPRCTRTGRPSVVLIQAATARPVQRRWPVGAFPVSAWRFQ